MRLALLLVLIAACGGNGDDVPDDARVLASVCDDIRDRWYNVLARVDRSCTTAEDCALAGGAEDCEGQTPILGPCDGIPVNRAAYEAEAAALSVALDGWDACVAAGCEAAGPCGAVDCRADVLTCTDNVCATDTFGSCLDP